MEVLLDLRRDVGTSHQPSQTSFTPIRKMAKPSLASVWTGECTPAAVARLLDEAPAQMVPLVRELSSWAADELAQALTAVPPPALPVASAAAAPPHAAPSAEPPIRETSEFPSLGARVQRLDKPPKRVTPTPIAATSVTLPAPQPLQVALPFDSREERVVSFPAPSGIADGDNGVIGAASAEPSLAAGARGAGAGAAAEQRQPSATSVAALTTVQTAGAHLAPGVATEAEFVRAIAAAATRHAGLAALASVHAYLLLEGWLPLMPPLHAAARCLLLPAPPAPPMPSPSSASSSSSCSSSSSLAAPALATTAEACAYSALLVRLCGKGLALLDPKLGEVLGTAPRLAAVSVPPSWSQMRRPHPQASLAAAAPSAAAATPSEAAAVAPSAAAVEAGEHTALRAHVLPAGWVAQPSSSSLEYTSSAEKALWHNRQRLFDRLLSLQETYPGGFHGGMGACAAAAP